MKIKTKKQKPSKTYGESKGPALAAMAVLQIRGILSSKTGGRLKIILLSFPVSVLRGESFW